MVLLSPVWSGAVAGIAFRVWWIRAPRWLYTLCYIVLGWAAVFYLPAFARVGGPAVVVLVIACGLLYTAGAVVYGRKRPDPWPRWFGFHEVFHALTLAAFTAHYNVSNALPKSAQPGAKKALQEIYSAKDRAHAEKAVTAFEKAYGAKFPKATAKITGEVDELLAFYDFPAEHRVHLRTTNPIESTFSTVKLRTKVTRGAGSPAAALAKVFELVESAQTRW
jgi:hypothetical protein